MPKGRCVFVLATPDYQPEMCSLTMPNLKAYADRLRADFYRIQERKFPDFPINYERMQIYELGKHYEWCLNIDADFLVRPDIDLFPDWHPPANVGNWWFGKVSDFFDVPDNKYFLRDGRNYALVDNIVATSWLTHDLWEPLPGCFEDYRNVCRHGVTRRISEFCVSQNLAKYGLKYSGILRRFENICHINVTMNGVQRPEEVARNKLREWGVL